MKPFLPPLAPLRRAPLPTWVPVLAIVVAVHLLVLLVWTCARPCGKRTPDGAAPEAVVTNAPPVAPLRELPARFPPNAYLPARREVEASGPIDMGSFSPGRDLMYLDDARVWWESDNDVGDDEDDHTIHRMMEVPLRRVIDMVSARGGRLKVQDTYRPTGVHNPRSLHREGRAIDLTCDEVSMEDLARICWRAGFDWVFHEGPSRQGAHVHCSVRRTPTPLPPPTSTGTRQTEDVD